MSDFSPSPLFYNSAMQNTLDLFSEPSPPVASVSDFVKLARVVLESSIPLGWVAGEISNFTRAASGHLYFSLKDAGAQVRCVVWRSRAQYLAFDLREGMQVEVRAQITVYEPRGEMQLSVQSIRQAGQGNLYEAYLRLKASLQAQGLFAPERKRALPAYPRAVGIVTSLAAAALQDVLATLNRRAPMLPVLIYPTLVQGDEAIEAIAQAIQTAGKRAKKDKVDVLLLCRGGGSIEDLWAFNAEAVVRAIAACPVPVVSGVGHETDVTLSDFAADVRAATPTAAAETITAQFVSLEASLRNIERHLQRNMQQALNLAFQRVDTAQRRLVHPRERLARHRALLEPLQLRLRMGWQQHANRAQARTEALSSRLTAKCPPIAARLAGLDSLENRLTQSAKRYVEQAHARVNTLQGHLALLNPEAVLRRGYAIVRDEQGRVIHSAQQASVGEALEVRLIDGSIAVQVQGN